MNASPKPAQTNVLGELATSALYTIVSVIALGLIYPLVVWGAAALMFPHQAGGSLASRGGQTIGSDIIGQQFAKPRYFWPRPSAAGKNGYDPTATGGTNLGPTSKKLIDATRATVASLRKADPHATLPIPMDLVTSSGSGIDPDISPEAAAYQIPRVAGARGMSVAAVTVLVNENVTGRTLGFLGEPHVNVLALNLALDAALQAR